MNTNALDRRTIVRGAAWTVPAVSVAAAAPALAASPTCEATYQSITKTFEYTDALGNVVPVDVTAHSVPLEAPDGSTLMAVETSTVVHLSDAARNGIGFFLGNPAQLDGTSTSVSVLSGALEGDSPSTLAIARTDFPSSGPLDLNASGQSDGQLTVPAGTAAGTVTITMGEPSSHLIGYNEDGSENGNEMDTVLSKIDGNDYVLATFEVINC